MPDPRIAEVVLTQCLQHSPHFKRSFAKSRRVIHDDSCSDRAAPSPAPASRTAATCSGAAPLECQPLYGAWIIRGRALSYNVKRFTARRIYKTGPTNLSGFTK